SATWPCAERATMAEAIRRLLGLVPVLLAGSILLFFLLGTHPKAERPGRLPLFFHPSPVSANTAAGAAMRGTERGDAERVGAVPALGAVAPPLVLPRVSEFGVAEGRRIAEAVDAVAARMQIELYQRGRGTAGATSELRAAEDRRLLAW